MPNCTRLKIKTHRKTYLIDVYSKAELLTAMKFAEAAWEEDIMSFELVFPSGKPVKFEKLAKPGSNGGVAVMPVGTASLDYELKDLPDFGELPDEGVIQKFLDDWLAKNDWK
jgi:hypothetical protein